MEQNYNDSYVIDLSYAVTASDIVYELSSIIDNDRAKNQKIVLKLGDVDLNQSQLLSIRSLINSINSTVEILETNSEQTELAAINLGIVVSEMKSLEAEQTSSVESSLPEPTYVQSYGYVKLEDHLPNDNEEDNKSEDSVCKDTKMSNDEKNASVIVEDFASKAGFKSEDVADDKQDVMNNEVKNEEVLSENIEKLEELKQENLISDEKADEIFEAKSEDIQDALDNIYASEVKLESILESEVQNEEGIISEAQVKRAILKEEKYTEADFEIDHFSTTYIKQTLRSGQIVNYDGNVVIIGDCHPGSEVIASGDITVWGVLSGIAHAGAKGNERARVRALKMNAIQLRIANCYARKPDGMNTIFPERSSTFTPEEARIINDEIVIFKIND